LLRGNDLVARLQVSAHNPVKLSSSSPMATETDTGCSLRKSKKILLWLIFPHLLEQKLFGLAEIVGVIVIRHDRNGAGGAYRTGYVTLFRYLPEDNFARLQARPTLHDPFFCCPQLD